MFALRYLNWNSRKASRTKTASYASARYNLSRKAWRGLMQQVWPPSYGVGVVPALEKLFKPPLGDRIAKQTVRIILIGLAPTRPFQKLLSERNKHEFIVLHTELGICKPAIDQWPRGSPAACRATASVRQTAFLDARYG
jgi:hypothetical protein